MFTLKHFIGGSLFVFLLAGIALAQENRAPVDNPQSGVPAAPLVTAAATAKRVRFVSPGTVVQLRLEVYNEAGQKLFDTQLHGGNVLDWHVQDGAGERLAAGSYACVLTVKSLSGRISQRLGLVKVDDEKAAVEAASADQLSTAQQQTIGPVEGNAAFTVLQESEAEAITAVTHDGTDGQLTRTRGAFSFRLGDFFFGKDKEQMRLTEEGNLGIGTDKPEARLDVAGDVHASGAIRARKGIEFADGTVQTSGLSGRKDKDGNIIPNAAGTGTTNQVAKWTETGGAGTLGDSTITEVSGRVGIGVPNPSYKLVVGPDIGPGLTTSDLTVSRGPGQSISAFVGASGANGMNFGWDQTNLRAFVNAPVQSPITFTHGGVNERMRIATDGNVGIGTNNPGTKLDVAGDINTATQYNIGGNGVLSVSGTNNVFVGVGTGQDTTGSGNSFFGASSRGAIGITNGTAIGSNAYVDQSNSLVLGSIGFNGSSVQGTKVGIGIRAPSAVLHVAGVAPPAGGGPKGQGISAVPVLRVVGGSGSDALGGNVIGGTGANVLIQGGTGGSGAPGGQGGSITLQAGFPGPANFFGSTGVPGDVLLAPSVGSVGIGTTAPSARLHVRDNNANILFGNAGCINPHGGIGFGPNLSGCNNYSLLGNGTDTIINRPTNGILDLRENNASQLTILPGGKVGIGTTSPNGELDVVASSGNADFFMRAAGATKGINFGVDGSTPNPTLFIAHYDGVNPAINRLIINADGTVSVPTRAAATITHLCILGSTIADCSSSLRYKERVAPLSAGLDLLSRLRPVSFKWKGREERDLGLIAEEVERVEPLLVTRNSAGQIQGVKYDQLSVVLINAVREQQAQIVEQREQLQQKHLRTEQLEVRLAALEVVIKKISDTRNRRHAAGLRSRAKGSGTTRR